MIDIDTENKKIFFYYTPEEIKKHPQLKEDMYEFDLLSAKICPDCKKILEAYYIGTLPIEENCGMFQKHPFLPSNNSGYDKLEPHYKFSHEYGGGYMILCNHNDTICQTHIAEVSGISEGIKSLINKDLDIQPCEAYVKLFASEIFEGKIPGISFIEDLCKNLSPFLSINKKEFTKNFEYKDYSDRLKELSWKEIFYHLVIRSNKAKFKLI